MLTNTDGLITIVEVPGRPDVRHVRIQTKKIIAARNGDDLGDAIFEAYNEVPVLILNFELVDYMNVDFLEPLLKLWKKVVKQDQRKLILCGIKGYALDVMRISHLSKLFTMKETLQEALED